MKEIIQKWKQYKHLPTDLKDALNAMDEKALHDAFYKNLAFGTGGMRGVVGAGTNRMNVFTIRKANMGFAKYLKQLSNHPSVVIAYDNRHKSVEFAKDSAAVLAKQGFKVYLFESLRPTPELSFAVRYLKASGGIVVTASHNPPEYNGYKIYDADGCQLVPKYADEVIHYVDEIDDPFTIEVADFDAAVKAGQIEWIGETIDRAYIDQVKTVQLNEAVEKNLKIVFTPLHGTSAKIGLQTLQEAGYDVYPVEEQMVADPDFSTVASPNPENKEAFDYAIKKGLAVNADLLIATDPDADRLGIAVKHDGEYVLLTGNQTGAIFVHYLLSQLKDKDALPKKGMVYNTIVTSTFGATIANHFGMGVKSTLTGFKFIGEQAKLIEDTDQTFVFGYEESYGYVIKDFVRDKDSIQAMLLACEVAATLAEKGQTLYDYLLRLYDTFGYFVEDLLNIRLEGAAGEQKIKQILESFRNNKPDIVLGQKVVKVEDYLVQKGWAKGQEYELTLPMSNVLKFFLEDGSWFVLRPSGTEPKLKVYVGVIGSSLDDANEKNSAIKSHIEARIKNI
jgi:phosphoglucomutase